MALIVPQRWHRAPRAGGLSAVTEARSDVTVVGAGLVGLSVAYELACLGARVTVVDGAHPGRATVAGAGILSPVTSPDPDEELWPFLRQCGSHYQGLLSRLAGDGVDVAQTGYGVCGALSIGLRAHEDEWFAPFADMVLRRSPGEVAEITPEEAGVLFPVLGPVHRVLHARSSARVDGRGMAAALHEAANRRGVAFITGTVERIEVSRATSGRGQSITALGIEGGGSVHCDAVAVAGGAWTRAAGEWFGVRLPVGPTKGQIVHLSLRADTGAWPIAQPLLTHYLVPWPGGRIACGGTFEPAAGYSTSVTAAGVHELLRECLTVAPALGQGSYLETRVGLRPTTADDRAIVGLVPGWSNAWVATGHGANGLLQGPYSARVVAHAVAGVDPPADEVPLPDAFAPNRFG
jgi:glycine/D-amino acid oxidase-like deaminating enzyme